MDRLAIFLFTMTITLAAFSCAKTCEEPDEPEIADTAAAEEAP